MKAFRASILAVFACGLSVFVTGATAQTITYYLYNRNSGLSLAPSGGGTADGTDLIQNSFAGWNGTSPQRWNLTVVGTNQFALTGVNSGRAMTIAGGQTGIGAPCELYSYTGANHQKFTLQSHGGRYYTMAFVHSGKVPVVNGYSTAPGAGIIQYHNYGVWNQQWLFVEDDYSAYPGTDAGWMSKYIGKRNATMNTHFDLIFDGDSITEFWKTHGLSVWNAYWAPKGAYNYGIAGDRMENLWWRQKHGQVTGIDPKCVVLLIGTNNLDTNSASSIASGIRTVANEYATRCPNAHVIVLGLLPRGYAAGTALRNKIIDINNQASTLHGTFGGRMIFMDIGAGFLLPDGTMNIAMTIDNLHPSAAGYQYIASQISPIVNLYVP